MFKYAIKQAYLSTDFKYRIGCVITDKSGRVIASGHNKRKTHPMQWKYAKRAGRSKKCFLHAEIAALVKCRGEGYAIYIARILKNGELGMAKPCPICAAAIEEAGIKHVYFTE